MSIWAGLCDPAGLIAVAYGTIDKPSDEYYTQVPARGTAGIMMEVKNDAGLLQETPQVQVSVDG